MYEKHLSWSTGSTEDISISVLNMLKMTREESTIKILILVSMNRKNENCPTNAKFGFNSNSKRLRIIYENHFFENFVS